MREWGNEHSHTLHNHTTVDPEVLGIYPKSINGDVHEVTSITNYYKQLKWLIIEDQLNSDSVALGVGVG